jgi:ketosteroid isomerase-like protein
VKNGPRNRVYRVTLGATGKQFAQKEVAMRSLVARVCLVALLVSIGTLPALAGKDLSELQATVDAMGEELVRATLEGDVDTAMKYYTEDSVSMPNYHGILKGLDEIRGYQENMHKAGVKFTAMDFTTLDLWKCGKLVYETGTYKLSLTMPGAPGPIEDTGKYMTIYQLQPGGELTIKIEIWNSDVNPYAGMGQQGRLDRTVNELALNARQHELIESGCD